MKTNIVKLRTRTASFHQRDSNRAEIMNTLSDYIWNSEVKKVVTETELSKATIMNIAYGNTQWPRPHTLFMLLQHFKLKLTLVPMNTR